MTELASGPIAINSEKSSHMRRRFAQAMAFEADMRQQAQDDARFEFGEQWNEDEQSTRNQEGRPCLTINRLPGFIRQVTNEESINRPGVTIDPVGSGSDIETAEVMEGLVRHIELKSDALAAYIGAGKSAAIMGWGWWTIGIKSYSRKSPNLDICIEPVLNPFSVYSDPNSIKLDGSDAKWRFIVETMTREAYKDQYPESKIESGGFWSGGAGDPDGWVTADSVRVAQYWRIEKKDGQPVVKWSITNGYEELDSGTWPTEDLPQVRVVGDWRVVDGQLKLFGMVKDMRDPQRQYNYWNTSATEKLALATKAPWLLAKGQETGFEDMWEQANRRNYAYLLYNPVSKEGDPLPPPQRANYEPEIMGAVHMIQQADNDLKAVSGIYDASLGKRGPNESGRAINARQQESNTSNANFMINLGASIKRTGKLMLDLIPFVYNTERVVRIVRADNTKDTVTLMAPTIYKGVERVFDLSAGEYDVVVSSGPSYETQRKEAADKMLDLAKADPNVMAVAGDIVVANIDIPGGQEIAKRLKRAIPPQITQDEGEGQQRSPQDVQRLAELDQYAQKATEQINVLTQELNRKDDELRQKNGQIEAQILIARESNESKERIAASQNMQKMLDTLASIDAQMAELKLQRDLKIGSQVVDHAHQRDMADSAAQNQAASQESAQSHAAELAKQKANQPRKGGSE